MIRKGQVRWLAKGDIVVPVAFIGGLLGLRQAARLQSESKHHACLSCLQHFHVEITCSDSWQYGKAKAVASIRKPAARLFDLRSNIEALWPDQ